MKVRDLIYHLAEDTEIAIQYGEESKVFEGEAQDVPYWIADEEIKASACIEMVSGVLVIDISSPANWPRKKKQADDGYKKAWEILRAQITLDSTKRNSVIHRRVLCELLRIMTELEQATAQ